MKIKKLLKKMLFLEREENNFHIEKIMLEIRLKKEQNKMDVLEKEMRENDEGIYLSKNKKYTEKINYREKLNYYKKIIIDIEKIKKKLKDYI